MEKLNCVVKQANEADAALEASCYDESSPERDSPDRESLFIAIENEWKTKKREIVGSMLKTIQTLFEPPVMSNLEVALACEKIVRLIRDNVKYLEPSYESSKYSMFILHYDREFVTDSVMLANFIIWDGDLIKELFAFSDHAAKYISVVSGLASKAREAIRLLCDRIAFINSWQ